MRCAPGCGSSASAASRPAPSTRQRSASCSTSGRAPSAAPPRLVDNKFGLVANAAARARLRPGTSEIRDLLSELEWAASSLYGPEDYVVAAQKAGRQPPFDAAVVAQVYAAYGELKRAQGVADFDDLLLLTAGVLEEQGDVAREFRDRYRSFVVDEYQDVTPLQQRLLDAWLGGRDDLCVVGDAHQTIYSFTGATPSYLLQFRQRFPEAVEVRLVRDYRSTPQVVGLANDVIVRSTMKAARLELVAQRPAGPVPSFVEVEDEPTEAALVAARCTALVAAGTSPSEIAILYRVNAQSAGYEAALTDAGVAYVIRGGERFFDRPGGPRGDPAAARRRPRRRRRRAGGSRRRCSRRAPRRPEVVSRRATGRGRRDPRPMGVARCAAPARRRPRPRGADRRACASSSPSSRSGRPPSTRRPSTG